MWVRTSLPSFVVAAGLLAAGHAWAGQPPEKLLTAADLPELGEPLADSSFEIASARGLGLDTPVSQLCANPRAKAVLDSDLPGLTTRPEYIFFKHMSLNKLKSMSRGKLTDADLAKVDAELQRISLADETGDR